MEVLYNKSLGIYEEKLGPNHPFVAGCLNNLAELYRIQGRYSEAEPIYKRSMRIYRDKLGQSHPNTAIVMNNLALLYQVQGRYSESESLYRQSLKIREKKLGPNHFRVAIALNNLSAMYLVRGATDMAKPLVQKLEVLEGEGVLPGNKSSVGQWYLLKSQYKAALDYYRDLLTHAQQNRNARDMFLAYTGLGKVCEAQQKYLKAKEFYAKGVKATEEIRSSLQPFERKNFLDVMIGGFYRTDPYEGLARVLLLLNRGAEAFKGSEYTKARVFAESMSRSAESEAFNIPQSVVKKDNELNSRLAALKKYLQQAYGKSNNDAITSLEPQVKEMEKKLQVHISDLRIKYPRFAGAKYPEPMDLTETALDDDEWILAYDVTNIGVLIYLTKGKQVKKALIKRVSRRVVDDLVRKFREPLEIQPGKDSVLNKLKSFDFESGKQLSDILLADILEYIPKDTPVTIIPDDSLGVLPFEMLVLNREGKIIPKGKIPCLTGAEFFGDRNPISYYQSVTALTLARNLGKKGKKAKKMLVMADPVFNMKDARARKSSETAKLTGARAKMYAKLMVAMEDGTTGGVVLGRLPLTSNLASNLKNMYGNSATVFTGMKANKQVFLKKVGPDLPQYKEVVFATMGTLAKISPEFRSLC